MANFYKRSASAAGNSINSNVLAAWSTDDTLKEMGAAATSFPTTNDDIFIMPGSSSLTIAAALVGRNFTMSEGYTQTVNTTLGITLSGSFLMSSGSNWNGTGGITLTGSGTIRFAGKQWGARPITINTVGTYTLEDAMHLTAALTFTAGTLNTAGMSLTLGALLSTGSLTRTLIAGTSTFTFIVANTTVWNVTSSGAVNWDVLNTTLNISAGGASIISGGIRLGNVNATGPGGFTISTNQTYITNLNRTVDANGSSIVLGSGVHIYESLKIVGTGPNPIRVGSNVQGTARGFNAYGTLAQPSVLTVDNVYFEDTNLVLDTVQSDWTQNTVPNAIIGDGGNNSLGIWLTVSPSRTLYLQGGSWTFPGYFQPPRPAGMSENLLSRDTSYGFNNAAATGLISRYGSVAVMNSVPASDGIIGVDGNPVLVLDRSATQGQTTASTLTTFPVLVTPGQRYSGRVSVQSQSTSRTARCRLGWMDAAGAEITASIVAGDTGNSIAGSWTDLWVSGIAPAGAVGVTVQVQIDNQGTAENHYAYKWGLWAHGNNPAIEPPAWAPGVARLALPNDDVILEDFDNGTADITTSGSHNGYCRNLTVNLTKRRFYLGGSGVARRIFGNLYVRPDGPGMYGSGTNRFEVISRDGRTAIIDATGDNVWFQDFWVHAYDTGSSVTFANNTNMNVPVNFVSGLFTFPANCWIQKASSTGSVTRTIDTRDAHIRLTGSQTVWNMSSGSGRTLQANANTIVELTDTSMAPKILSVNSGNAPMVGATFKYLVDAPGAILNPGSYLPGLIVQGPAKIVRLAATFSYRTDGAGFELQGVPGNPAILTTDTPGTARLLTGGPSTRIRNAIVSETIWTNATTVYDSVDAGNSGTNLTFEPVVTYPISDPFTGADNTVINGRVVPTGQTWIARDNANTNALQIFGNGMRSTAAGTFVAWLPSLSSVDMVVRSAVRLTGNYESLLVRVTDSANWLSGRVNPLNQMYELQVSVNGTVTTLKSAPVLGYAIVTSHLEFLELKVSGSTLTLFSDGKEVISYTGPEVSARTGTSPGVRISNASVLATASFAHFSANVLPESVVPISTPPWNSSMANFSNRGYYTIVQEDSPSWYIGANDNNLSQLNERGPSDRVILLASNPKYGPPLINEGRGMLFEGSFDWAPTVPLSGGAADFTKNRTYEFWVKTSQNIGTHTLVQANSGSTAKNEDVLVINGVLNAYRFLVDGTPSVAATTPIADGLPHHIVVVIQDDTRGTAFGGTLALYKDNALVQTITYPSYFATAAGNFEINQSRNSRTNLVGTIDEIAYYRYALPASRIEAHYTKVLNAVVETGMAKVNINGVWTMKPAKVYLNGSWVTKPMKRYDGNAWIALD